MNDLGRRTWRERGKLGNRGVKGMERRGVTAGTEKAADEEEALNDLGGHGGKEEGRTENWGEKDGNKGKLTHCRNGV